MKGGVKLTQFYQQKIGQTTSTIEEINESEQVDENDENTKSTKRTKDNETAPVRENLNWQERISKRERLQKQLSKEPLVPSNIINGGVYKVEGATKMSIKEYQT